MGKFGFVGAICQSNFVRSSAEHLKVKKPIHVREMKIHLHSAAIIQVLAPVFTSLWMKSHEIKRKTARDVWPCWTFREACEGGKSSAIYLPPFKHGRWHTGFWQRSPFHAAEHMHTLGRMQRPPLIHGGPHKGNWHRPPMYSWGHLHTLRETHSPPFWHLGEQGAARKEKKKINNSNRTLFIL